MNLNWILKFWIKKSIDKKLGLNSTKFKSQGLLDKNRGFFLENFQRTIIDDFFKTIFYGSPGCSSWNFFEGHPSEKM